MGMKKRAFKDEEIAIYDDAVVYKRGEYWQFRMWLYKERKYVRISLKTTNRSTAIDKAKKQYHDLISQQMAGKRYFSLTTKQGVEMYVNERAKDVQARLIVEGRLGTIKTHLSNWLDVIGKEKKLKDLERTDCEQYFYERTKTKRKISISQTTVKNEQSTINAMMKWLYRQGETNIDEFFFKKLPKIDKGLEENRRQTFTHDEVQKIYAVLDDYVSDAMQDLTNDKNVNKALAGCYFAVALNTGLRSGEQRQLKWDALSDTEHVAARKRKDFDLFKITVRGETSKVRNTRTFIIKDRRKYFTKLLHIAMHRTKIKSERSALSELEGFVFSCDGKKMLTQRMISYHFYKVIELASINIGTRDIVPYSTRHYFITQRINSGLDLMSVAELAGTSAVQIERTYYYTTQEKMFRNALQDYEVQDGVLVVSNTDQ